MREITSDHVGRWTRGAGLLALVAVAWGGVVPGGVFWSAVVAASLVGSAVATAMLVRSRSIPSLARVSASEQAEPVVLMVRNGYTGGAGLRPRGEGKP
jgi:hypothetical protein